MERKHLRAQQGLGPKKQKARKAGSELEKERKQLNVESSELDKAQVLKKEKACSGLEKRRK